MGSLRLFLALSVVAGHGQGRILAMPGFDLHQSVDVFFLISGFYMALVLNEKYVRPGSHAVFYVNRALRLYPVYFVGLALAIFPRWIVTGLPFGNGYDGLDWGGKLFFLVSNLVIFGQDLAITPVLCFAKVSGSGCGDIVPLVPPAWSLGAELIFYLIAPFVVRSVRATLGLLAAGIAYSVAVGLLAYPLDGAPAFINPTLTLRFVAHYPFPATLPYFAIGALSYLLLYRQDARRAPPLRNYALVLAACGTLAAGHVLTPWWMAALFAVTVPMLFTATAASPADRFLGELSYPVYILHYPLIIPVRRLLGLITGDIVATTLAAVTLLLAVAALMVIDRPIDRLRQGLVARRRKPAVAAA